MYTPQTPAQYDLGALVVKLRALVPFHAARHMGRAVQQFGLAQIGCVDPTLAEYVHDSTTAKPFTVSGLMNGDAAIHDQCDPGQPAWIRLTALSAPVVAALEARREDLNRQLESGERVIVELDRQPWKLESIGWENAEWSGRTSYQALIDSHRFARPAPRLGLHFITASAFRTRGTNLPLPVPALVFGSLLSRWQTFTAHRLRDLPDDQVDAYLTHCIHLSRHDIQTVLYHGKQGGKQIGFVGRTTFELVRRNPQLQRSDEALAALLEREYIWMARLVNLLADFAFYSGIGLKTTTGMGMVRCDWTGT